MPHSATRISTVTVTDAEMSRVSTDLSLMGTLSTEVQHKSLLRACRLRSLVGGFGFHFKARNLASQSVTEEEAVELFALSKKVEHPSLLCLG